MADEQDVVHKRVDSMLIASTRFRGTYEGVGERFDKLHEACGEYAPGPGFCIYHYGTGPGEGSDIEVCLPVTQAVETGEIKSRTLESTEVISVIHHGPHENLRESTGKLWHFFGAHGLPAQGSLREVFVAKGEKPEENVIEVQAILHPWNDLLAHNVERVLGTGAKAEVMQGASEITPMSSVEERGCWLKGAMTRLEALTDDEQRFDILSRCAHVFPQERIDQLKAIYERSGDIDDVLKEMDKDPDWYESPARDGSIIYVTKVPFDPEECEKATTEAERRKSYCHCPMVRELLDESSPTFCYCGTGWYRRLWESILEKPVQVRLLKSLVKGDDCCQVAIHLPL